MRRCLAVILLITSACSTRPPVSDAEAGIEALADERRGAESFPVLRPLPQADRVRAMRLPRTSAQELRLAARDLEGLRAELQADDTQSIEETAQELRSMVEKLRAGQGRLGPVIDREALGIPTPPPRQPSLP
jgi:hypothetical protein